CQQYGIYPLTF
nr:immunoglobulin light chain junction region [Macaca mulatta]MOX98605.1 immunoglobulin light chain junction region [Macaca mulatta]MOY01361.1 immunoglobulin light chain junction region [Macaca mulatta]MOY01882.1 immunoglobulin light chain junction region [Macaca mulatta]